MAHHEDGDAPPRDYEGEKKALLEARQKRLNTVSEAIAGLQRGDLNQQELINFTRMLDQKVYVEEEDGGEYGQD